MLRIGSIFILVFALLGLTGAPALAGGLLAVSQNSLEFGALKEGEVARKMITVSNVGDASLVIANVATSCSCTTTSLGASTLRPGEKTSLEIVYNTYKFPGTFKKYVTLAWGEGGREQTVITMTGDVSPLPMGVLAAEPRKIEAGAMVVGQAVNLTLRLKNVGDAALQVDKVAAQKSGAVYFDAATSGALRLAPGEEKDLPLTVTASAPGNYLEYLMVFSDARNVTDKGYKVVVVGAAK